MLFYVLVEVELGLVLTEKVPGLVVGVWVDPGVAVGVDVDGQGYSILVEYSPDGLGLLFGEGPDPGILLTAHILDAHTAKVHVKIPIQIDPHIYVPITFGLRIGCPIPIFPKLDLLPKPLLLVPYPLHIPRRIQIDIGHEPHHRSIQQIVHFVALVGQAEDFQEGGEQGRQGASLAGMDHAR